MKMWIQKSCEQVAISTNILKMEQTMQMISGFSLLALVLGLATCIHANEQVRVLIIDGQNNHN